MTCKKCSRCKVEKNIDEFDKRGGKRKGQQAYCKKCNVERMKERWNKGLVQVNKLEKSEYDRTRRENNVIRSRQNQQAKAWTLGNLERIKTAAENRKLLFPEKIRAQRMVINAVQRGRIEKPDACSCCGKNTPGNILHGHHDDYSKPLEVDWLCASCHGLRHSLFGKTLHLQPGKRT